MTLFQITNPFIGTSGRGPGAPILGRIVSATIGFFVVIGFIVAFLYLLMGAMNWITAGGDKSKLETARLEITQALVGLIVLVSIWALMLVIGRFLGIGFPNLVLPTVN